MTIMIPRIALALCLVAPAPWPRTSLAAPQVIVLNGGPLRQRTLLADFAENHQLMLATTDHVSQPSADSLRGRPRIRVAMYWGFQWKGRTDLSDSVSVVAAMNGAQAGAFYPAWRGRSALWVFAAAGGMASSTRTISKEGLAILARHGIPVVADEQRDRRLAHPPHER